MRPIEAGCKAVVVNAGRNNGKLVTVGIFIGEVVGFVGRNRWSVDKPMKGKGTRTGKEKPPFFHTQEHMLRRIDEHPEELSSWSAIESLGWKRPVEETV